MGGYTRTRMIVVIVVRTTYVYTPRSRELERTKKINTYKIINKKNTEADIIHCLGQSRTRPLAWLLGRWENRIIHSVRPSDEPSSSRVVCTVCDIVTYNNTSRAQCVRVRFVWTRSRCYYLNFPREWRSECTSARRPSASPDRRSFSVKQSRSAARRGKNAVTRLPREFETDEISTRARLL